MSIIKYTRNEIVERLKKSIQDYDSQVDVEYGSVKDIVIDPISEELRLVNDNIYHTSRIQSLLNYAEMSEEELDNFAANWQIVRKDGTRAYGTVWFRSSSPPGEDTQIPLNTTVAASIEGAAGNTSMKFVTTEVRTFHASAGVVESYYNAEEQMYEIAVPVMAMNPGIAGNVASGSITILTSGVSFTEVVNKEATAGGTEQESNTQLARRLALVLLGIERSTIQGLELWFEDQSGVIDACVIDAQDPLMIRTEAGGVDVAIIGTEYATYQQTLIFNRLTVILEKQPVKSILSIIGLREYIEGTEWTFVKDTTSNYAGSVRATSKIEWRSIDTLPAIGETITITYQYDKKVEDLQSLVEEDDNRFLADILVKSAEQINIELALRIKVYTGFNQSNTRQFVKDALYSFINTLKLGMNVEQSDLVFEIRKIAGVDNVEIPFVTLKVEGPIIGALSEDIVIRKDQYARISSGMITVWSS